MADDDAQNYDDANNDNGDAQNYDDANNDVVDDANNDNANYNDNNNNDDDGDNDNANNNNNDNNNDEYEAPVQDAVPDKPKKYEEPVQDEVPDKPKNDEVKEEPKKEKPKPKPKAKKKKKKAAGKYTVSSAFKSISKDKNPINWYTAKLVNPKKSNGKLKFDKAGTEGISELQEYLKPQSDQIVFALLRVNSLDNSNSVRAKFVFFRFLGSKVGVMTKAKLNPQKETIQNQFPVRHMDVNISEDLKGCDIESLSKEFLRIGGAHKPDKYDFGGDQMFNCK